MRSVHGHSGYLVARMLGLNLALAVPRAFTLSRSPYSETEIRSCAWECMGVASGPSSRARVLVSYSISRLEREETLERPAEPGRVAPRAPIAVAA